LKCCTFPHEKKMNAWLAGYVLVAIWTGFVAHEYPSSKLSPWRIGNASSAEEEKNDNNARLTTTFFEPLSSSFLRSSSSSSTHAFHFD